MIKTIDIKKTKTGEIYKYLSNTITPRPIAFVSSIDKKGNKNLSPFSFFNVFSVDPPILVFAPVKRVKDNTSKDTLQNVERIKECVVALVSEEMVQQVSLSSCNYDHETNEFEKAGFREVESECIAPPRVKEAPINFECKVNQIITLGDKGGAGSLVVCEVLKIHIDEKIIDSSNDIDPLKLNIVSRYGKNWYGKTSAESLFEIPKPISSLGIGFDHLPREVKQSNILTGSELAILASIEKIPEKEDFPLRDNKNKTEKHILAKAFIKEGYYTKAWQILL